MIRFIKLAVHYIIVIPLAFIASCLFTIAGSVDMFMRYDYTANASGKMFKDFMDEMWTLLSGREL